MALQREDYITEVAYTNRYYEQLSPLVLNYIAGLNGVAPRDLSSFSYCELGCGGAVSLLVHAGAYPSGKFLGIDPAQDQIQQAADLAKAAQLDNLLLYPETVASASGKSFTKGFDFIALHGLYSWVPDSVRKDIHQFIDRHLEPGGLVQITYNAAPGSTFRSPLRDMMQRFALPLSQYPLEQAELGISYLQLLLSAQAPIFRANPDLASYAESLCKRDLRYIAHEYFNPHWAVFNVEAVADSMAGLGLEFVGSLPLWQNHPEADVPEGLRAFLPPETPRLVRERHKDFILNTPFRNDLFVKPANPGAARLSRAEALGGMHFRATVPAESLNPHPRVGMLDVPLNTREGRMLANLLCEQTMTLAELSADMRLSGVSADELTLMLNWWVASGQVRPAQLTPENDTTRNIRESLNAQLLKQAMHDENVLDSVLVSHTFGCGFPHPKQLALALIALHDPDPANHFQNMRTALQACELSFEDSGESSAADLESLCAELLEELHESGALEVAERQGLFGSD